MKYRRLGNSGLQVSLAGLGTNNFGGRLDYEGTASVVDAAIDAGINFFDTADIYGGGLSEEYLGRALGSRREDVLIATKFAMPMGEGPFTRGGSRHYIERAVAASLRRLGTDYIDVYQMHQPDGGHADRGDAGGADGFGAPWGRALHRALELQRLADRRTRTGRRGARVWRGSFRRKTSGACWSARWSRRSCRPAASSGWGSCPSSRWRAGS